jgi:serine/threonine protein kinase
MAPEALKDLEFSVDSEVFSIGVIIYEMLHGKTPWTAESEKKLLENMLSVKPTI